jgi:hypothetical protein
MTATSATTSPGPWTGSGAPGELSRWRLHGLAWLAWRQHRAALLGAVLVLVCLGAALTVNGVVVRSAWTQLGLERCAGLRTGDCRNALGLFVGRYGGWAVMVPRIAAFLPGALGMFIGAPLVAREFETGTFRFAWTQGRSRGEWITAKLLLLGLVLVGLSLGFSALAAWWAAPWLPIRGRTAPGEFYEVLGLVFAGRTLVAFTLGAALGAVLRRTLPAMVATAALWLGGVYWSALHLRPHIEAPVELPADSAAATRTDWVVSQWVQSPTGQRIDTKSSAFVDLFDQARAQGSSGGRFDAWLVQHHWTSWVALQPTSRFWHLQAVEATGYLLLGLLLGALTIWLVRRRAT